MPEAIPFVLWSRVPAAALAGLMAYLAAVGGPIGRRRGPSDELVPNRGDRPMNVRLMEAVLLAWPLVVVALFRAIGPRRAVLVGVLAGNLLLPNHLFNLGPAGLPFSVSRYNMTGLGLLLGVLAFDRRTLLQPRPSWLDLPMLAFCLAPLVGLATGVPGSSVDVFDLVICRRGLGWLVLYAMGRIYLNRDDSPAEVAAALTIAGLCYIPICIYEEVAGPSMYLGSLIYGIPAKAHMVDRLGGWRPEGLVGDGLELSAWMAMSTLMATWLWLGGRRLGRWPSWPAALALVLATLSCRGVYGYLILAIGLPSALLTRSLRTRAVLATLIVVPVLYMGLRSTAIWDGRVLVRLATHIGREGTVDWRLIAEDQVIQRVLEYNPVFGLGNHIWNHAGTLTRWPDGGWLHVLWTGGFVGLALWIVAIHALPAALALSKPSGRPDARQAAAPSWALACWCILHMIDGLHNTSYLTPTALIAGTLIGCSTRKRTESTGSGPASPGRGARPTSSAHATYRIRDLANAAPAAVDVRGRVGFVLAVTCLLYIFGHAQVEGQEALKFVGGLGAALLFTASGAAVAGLERRSLARAMAFGLAFAILGISFNLALHASSRPIWSADILQGMALTGIVVAIWRKTTGGGPLAYAVLAVLAAAWWALEPSARPFWGSQYLFSAPGGGDSLFPVLPWLALAAVGAALVDVSPSVGLALAVGFGLSASTAWGLGRPFGPPLKFPLNPTYALLGASLASAAFAASKLVERSKAVRAASGWLGRRWLVFFYVHLGIAFGLARLGLTRPIACWAALVVLSMVATWLISELGDRLRPVFRQPITWVVLAASTLAAGLVPGLPDVAVLAVAGSAGLLFAARYDELATLTLGPPLAEVGPRIRALDDGGLPSYLAKVALVVAVLVAPELLGRLPAPIGTAPRPTPEASADVGKSGSSP